MSYLPIHRYGKWEETNDSFASVGIIWKKQCKDCEHFLVARSLCDKRGIDKGLKGDRNGRNTK